MRNNQTLQVSKEILLPETAGIIPEKFTEFRFPHKKLLIAALVSVLLIGFSLRVRELGTESLSEDELNKLQTVAEYRSNGLSGRNGEHPFLMKGLQTVSISAAEKINNSFFPNSPDVQISEEAALRFPTALFGTFTALLIFLLITELFGSSIGLISAALWAVDPNAIGFDRIAKEDSFLLFFFLLGNFLWIRSQSKSERGEENWLKYSWLAAAAFGAMVASKYMPHLLGVPAAYNKVFQLIPNIKWRFNRYRWLKFFIVLGIGFVICNPTILLPETWREMMIFASEKRIGHDSYEFAGELYRNQITAWLSGVPWTFYYVFILVKTPLLTLIFFLVGLSMMFFRKLGDGRYFLFFWALMWFLPFTFLGGKFVRYFTLVQPLILIIAAVGIFFAARFAADLLFGKGGKQSEKLLSFFLLVVVISSSLAGSISTAPHYRLFVNSFGDHYFPHDEFYDTSTKETVKQIARLARPNAIIANETPYLFDHYFKKEGRKDLVSVSLSDKTKIASLSQGDFIIAAQGRRYFSNDAYLKILDETNPVSEIEIGGATSVKIYQPDEETLAKIKEAAKLP